ncbi:hypothetical protein CFter6_4577 [Collimonas fungivorans]|uniref:Uncharacterized protein n=1 Tax=Collimonas fungivorans TaxID=158899 RepID=A0A127PHE3_9BURK|nr:hypothetical protein CFter6_4577 [Collimonas fungivorans]
MTMSLRVFYCLGRLRGQGVIMRQLIADFTFPLTKRHLAVTQ